MEIMCITNKLDALEERPIMAPVDMVKITKFNIPSTMALHVETRHGFDPITMVPTNNETKVWKIFLNEVTLIFEEYNVAKAYFHMLCDDKLDIEVKKRHPEFFV